MDDHKPFRAFKSERGWCLNSVNGETIVYPDGFVAWFKSRAKALSAADAVTYDAENEWLVYDYSAPA